MRHSILLALAAGVALVCGSSVRAVGAPAGWLGEEMPLQLPVRTPQDLAVKAVAERQYLIFNLLARGKLAWDSGDYATAAGKWEALLALPKIDPEIERVIRPLAREARSRAGGQPVAVAPTSPEAPEAAAGGAPPTAPTTAPASAPSTVTVNGTITGGGSQGTGGAVVWLKRVGAETPRPSPARGKMVSQRGKMFIPHVLAVPVGSKVDFRNDDAIYHNVFSLSKPNEFDTGLYKQGATYTQVFKRPGPVQLLCNIHSSMVGYVYVVDSPYFAQADGAGAFTIRGVPPGEFDVEVWYEGSSKNTRQRLTVGPDGVRGLTLRVGGDRQPPAFVPDKSGKPRQSHLGY
jgi:plastocyanin